MTKNRSKSLFVIFSILLVICLVACFVNFNYPLSVKGNYYSYSNFVENLKLGEDVSSSLRIVYRAEQGDYGTKADYANLRSSTMSDLKKIVEEEGYKDVTVAEYGEDCIVLQVGNLLTEEDEASIINLIGNPAAITFSTQQDGSNPFADAKKIKSVNSLQYNNPETGEVSYLVAIEFIDSFKSEIASTSSKNTIYIYLGEQSFVPSGLSSGAIDSNGIIYLESPSFTSLLDATTCANQIKTGMLDLSLTQVSSDIISPTYGRNANWLLAIAMSLVVLAAFVFLVIKYRDMGWLACFNLLFFIVISLFLLQSIPLVHINFAGLLTMLIGFILTIDSLLTIFEKAKEHYNNGTQLYIAFREAQKESLFKTLFLNAVILISGFICLFMPIASIQSFGWVALVISLVSTFTNLALMRLFIKMYLALNNENGNKCNFHKGGKKDAQ